MQLFDRGNIDGQHLRPPVLAILLEGKIGQIASVVSNLSICPCVKKLRYMVLQQKTFEVNLAKSLLLPEENCADV